ncbi:hypothetical protein Runsl_4727 [Runella slithyformis DSM 19594]|uniref:Uncharacterized protein n=2 Tax=Runella TaxID=105 RepID=A0A7U3ZPM1_RUNSL|nr:hypothetical protein Runsl_4727 [Runella slithyformis DSM 19594]
MLEEIFDIAPKFLPRIHFEVTILRHERLGEGAIRVLCTVNNISANRVIKRNYETPFTISTYWFIDERKVNNYYASILENIYESQVKGGAVLVY